jgi:predicted outer membrane repeat protein
MVGGGIYNWGEVGPATLTVVGSTISGNLAGGAGGGGIKNDGSPTGSATVNMTNCTISGNSTTGNGGGIQNDGLQGHATLNVVRSTLSGNSANVAGGALAAAQSIMTAVWEVPPQ